MLFPFYFRGFTRCLCLFVFLYYVVCTQIFSLIDCCSGDQSLFHSFLILHSLSAVGVYVSSCTPWGSAARWPAVTPRSWGHIRFLWFPSLGSLRQNGRSVPLPIWDGEHAVSVSFQLCSSEHMSQTLAKRCFLSSPYAVWMADGMARGIACSQCGLWTSPPQAVPEMFLFIKNQVMLRFYRQPPQRKYEYTFIHVIRHKDVVEMYIKVTWSRFYAARNASGTLGIFLPFYYFHMLSIICRCSAAGIYLSFIWHGVDPITSCPTTHVAYCNFCFIFLMTPCGFSVWDVNGVV